jgi:hypothetical protein
MGEYRRGEYRSGTSQLGMLVEQEAGKHSKLYAPKCNCGEWELLRPNDRIHVAGSEQLVRCPEQCTRRDRWDVHDLRPLPAVHRRIGMGQPVELVWRERRSQDQADRLRHDRVAQSDAAVGSARQLT